MMKMPAKIMQQEGTASASLYFQVDLAMDELLWVFRLHLINKVDFNKLFCHLVIIIIHKDLHYLILVSKVM